VIGIVGDLISESAELRWAFATIAICLPFEMLFGTGHKVAWSERFGNIGATLVNFIVGVTLLALALKHPLGQRLLDYPDTPRWSLLGNPLAYAVVVVFLADGLYYLYHRLQHAVPLLWHIHKLHHTDPAVNITTSRRTHFLERPIQFIVLVAPVLWLFGAYSEGLVYTAFLSQGLIYFSHLDVRVPLGPLTAVIVGPQYHRVHHSRVVGNQHSNFAQAFPVFDMLGGTYHRPAHSEYPVTGVVGYDTPASRWRPLVW
jgi:sterol desaturase/sphingolipid hydroxylase (fatty acid hydroxylase superfamily)